MKIGITGHQKLLEEHSVEWVEGMIRKELISIGNICVAYSSLAIGADQLFARVILAMNIDLIAVLPCIHYENTFNEPDKAIYFELLSKCKAVEILDFIVSSEVAFFSAGKQIVDKLDILFAIWDGQHAKGLGGTGDIVEYALSRNKKVIHFNHILKKTITHNF